MKIKIAIADNQSLFREGLGFIMNTCSDFKLIIKAKNGQDLLEQMKSQAPDIVLLDLKMPIMDGLATSKKIKELYKDVKIMILTRDCQEAFILELYDIGVNGYMLKNASPKELIDAIYAVFQRKYYFSQDVSQVLFKQMNQKKKPVQKSPENIYLTAREQEVLNLICEEYTTTQIAGKLFLSVCTIESYRKRLLEKFKVKNSVGLAVKAVKDKLFQPAKYTPLEFLD